MKFYQRKKAFTLIELLLYVAIAGIVMTSVSTLLFQVMQSRAKAETISLVKDEADIVVNSITESVKMAKNIITPSPGSNGTSFSLEMSDLTKNPTIYNLNNGKITLKEGSSTAIDLTSSKLEATALNFETINTTPAGVKLSFTLRHSNPSNRYEFSFQKTYNQFVVLRK